MPLPSVIRPARIGAVLPIVLGILAGLAVLLRILAISEPLGIDQSLWASAVRGMARGQLLYRDVWEQRPPGIYLTYLGAFSLFGWTAASVAWLDALAAAITTSVLYTLARALAGRTAGALAAALYAVLTMPAWLYRNGGFLERSVCETFIVVCVGFAALCALRLRQRQSLAMAFGIGVWAGAAVVFKPNAGLYFPAILVWGLAGPASAGVRVRAMTIASLGALLLPVLTIGWLWRLGVLADARTAVIDFNRWYVAEGFSLSAYPLAFSRAIWLRMKTDPLWLAGGVASLAALWTFARTRRLSPLASLAVLWGGAAALVIAVNGIRLFNSYFIQAFAPLALLAAWWLTEGSSGSKMRRACAVATILLMGALLFQRNYVTKVAGTAAADAKVLLGWTDPAPYLDGFGGYANARGYSARANAELAAYVRAHTIADDRIYLFGINGAGVYFLADRLTAHRFLRVNFYVPDAFPNPAFTLAAVVDELRVRQPSYLIFEQLHSESDMGRAVDALMENPLIRSLLQTYTFETRIEDFTLFRRR